MFVVNHYLFILVSDFFKIYVFSFIGCEDFFCRSLLSGFLRALRSSLLRFRRLLIKGLFYLLKLPNEAYDGRKYKE